MKDFGIELDKLYHYSTPAGFAGISKSKSLWMTNIRYQNDMEEYSYAVKLTLEVLKEYDPPIPYHGIYFKEDVPIYTFSLTGDNDSLSQWRGYTPDGGFAFSFKHQMLANVINRYNLELVQCVYDVEAQKEIIRSKVIGMLPAAWSELYQKAAAVSFDKNTVDGYAHHARTRGWRAMGFSLAQYAPVLKHPQFREEKEWRLIKDTLDPKGERVRWSGKSGQNRALSFACHERQPPTRQASAL
ncbi:DUF2971 domain-containing protein [Hymenobacter cavernae]|uniref:DUF2971 domain-containing protein n=1 Tax=Hymenobacter cavernae TaxID=2044852 RepID=A0ABQ1UUV1_9BACT|nr:DUF2971 domain-containing protein [Hymenobacter cavernae]GGF27133.1 hypothetical protein GCM10011383_43430 [Hymenobacter cavernae]